MHSVANLATLQTPLATFFPSKKRPNLVTGTATRGLALPARTHLSLSLSASAQFLSQRAPRTHLSPSLSLSASAQFLSQREPRTHLSLSLSLCVCSVSLPARGREEQRFNSVKHRYYVASLILHSSTAEITAQLLSLSYVYLISSDDGTIINQDFCAD